MNAHGGNDSRMGSESEMTAPNGTRNHSIIDTQPRMRGMSYDQPNKIAMKKPKIEPNYVNGEKIDEVNESIRKEAINFLDVSKTFSFSIHGIQRFLLVCLARKTKQSSIFQVLLHWNERQSKRINQIIRKN